MSETSRWKAIREFATKDRPIWVFALVLFALFTPPVLLMANSGEKGTGDQTEAAAPESGADVHAELACRHFRNVAGDVDILTQEQLLAKLREVNRDAANSWVAEIATSARRLLADETRNRPTTGSSIQDLDRACQRVGW